jgi:uncharacterized protein with PIN domain
MPVAHARFYAELNDHLPAPCRHVQFPCVFDHPCSLREFIAGEGVPSDEVDLVLVNGVSADLSRLVRDGDRVSVYPVFETFEIGTLQKIRDRPLRRPRFVLDVHLGKLSSLMRMLGIDTLYSNSYTDEEIVAISLDQGRAVLSKDRGLLHHEALTRRYHVREKNPRLQLREVVDRFDLRESVAPFTRCMRCNTLLEKVPREEILERLPPRVRENHTEFWQCATCTRVFWQGTHYERMKAFVLHLTRKT